VFAKHGYHGVSVERILLESGLSRPTFYRYFSNADEVIDLLMKEVNDELIEGILTAIRLVDNPFAKVEAGLLAWRKWGENVGPMLKSIFAELHDTNSPAAVQRKRVQETLAQEFNQAVVALGRKPISPLQIDTFVVGVEYLGYRLHFGPDGPTEAAWLQTRQVMMRLAFGLLGTHVEWAMAPQVATMLGIDLS
jgi:AcrR family transcriptional regulator